MSDGSERPYTRPAPIQDRRASASHARDWVQWVREAVTIIAAAGAAYMGIRVDLARNQMDIDYLKQQQARIEAQVERMREKQASGIQGHGDGNR